MKKVLVLSGAAIFAVAAALSAHAQDYPNKPIRLIVPYPPGAATDISARIIADAMSQQLGQQMVVENRGGAGGITGVEYVAKAAPDGYTLGWPSAVPITMIPVFKKAMPYKVSEDFAFIGKFAETSITMTISTKFEAKTVKEFVDHVKANPGKFKSGTSGIAGTADLATYLFEKHTGTELHHIHYQGTAPAMTDLLGGHMDVVMATPASVATQQSSDKIRTIAVTSSKRHPLLPNVPTFAEVGYPGIVFTSSFGMIAPAGIPAPVLARLRAAFSAAVAQPGVQERAAKAALELAILDGDEFRRETLKEIAVLSELRESAKIPMQD